VLGVDARELFPAMSSGATRADALLQHLKQRGKGPGQILESTEQLFNYKFLPSHLRFEFDFQDDAQDRQVAEIHQIRSNTRRQDLDSGVVDTRIAREMAVSDGDLSRDQFERLELEDARLPDGSDVVALFYSKDPDVKAMLDLNVSNPTEIEHNDPLAMIDTINAKITENTTILINSNNPDRRWTAYQAVAALKALREEYQPENDMAIEELPNKPNNFTTQQKNPAGRSVDRRVRRQEPTTPNAAPMTSGTKLTSQSTTDQGEE